MRAACDRVNRKHVCQFHEKKSACSGDRDGTSGAGRVYSGDGESGIVEGMERIAQRTCAT